jgi:deoxyadenosine/deoxycytidine kinase
MSPFAGYRKAVNAALISIIGPVAVGKTTLAELLCRELPAEIIREDYAGNPFLAESYTGRDDLLLPSQLYFLLSRSKQLCRAQWPAEGLFVSDYGFCQDRIFARLKLSDGQMEAYDAAARAVEAEIVPPRVMVRLDASIETLQGRIAGRGREYEAVFTQPFLRGLREAHRAIEPPPESVMIDLDCERVDLREEPARRELLQAIRDAL